MSRHRERWELEDPESVLRAIDRLCPFVEGGVVVALIALDTRDLVHAVLVPERSGRQPCWDPFEASERLCDVALGLMSEHASSTHGLDPMTHLLVTVVCREGRVVDTMAEHRWFSAWRYSNHLTGAIQGDVYVVTPHGWTGVMDHRAGRHPRLRPRLALVTATQPDGVAEASRGGRHT